MSRNPEAPASLPLRQPSIALKWFRSNLLSENGLIVSIRLSILLIEIERIVKGVVERIGVGGPLGSRVFQDVRTIVCVGIGDGFGV